MPVSRATVATHIVLKPDMIGYSVDSEITYAKSASKLFDGKTMATLWLTVPRGSKSRILRNRSCRPSRSTHVERRLAPDDEKATDHDLAALAAPRRVTVDHVMFRSSAWPPFVARKCHGAFATPNYLNMRKRILN